MVDFLRSGVLQNAFRKGYINLPNFCLLHYSVLMPHKAGNWNLDDSASFKGFNSKFICCIPPVWTQTCKKGTWDNVESVGCWLI